VDLGLAGKVALVTGAGRGIGAEIARTLAREGCDVALADVDTQGPVTRVAEEIREMGRETLVTRLDVRDFNAAAEAVAWTVQEMGGLHIVVSNAGITRDAVSWKLTEEAWDAVLEVNLKGCFNVVRAAIPTLRAQGWGRVVAVSSINGLRGKFGQANYAASKAGLVGLAKTLARETGAFGVTVNVVAPGMVQTEMAAGLPESILASARSETVRDRLTEPREVAETVAFLCSEAASGITGETVRVDSGQYI
jgi:3-oxoacyl-[acyl-carrier protein] reductase